MPKTRPPYSPEFRRQMIDLVRAGRDPEELAKAFEPTAQSIRFWVAAADRQEGRQTDKADSASSAERDELLKLRRENKQLRLERDILSRATDRNCATRIFEFMSADRADFSIAAMARVLGASESGYHAWRQRAPSARSLSDGMLLKSIRTVHAGSRDTYGAPRVHAALQAQGQRHGRKRIARLVRLADLVGASRRRSGVTITRRDKAARPAPDLVDRNFKATQPNQLWVADITFVPTATGFLYLAVVLDAWSRKIVGWAMANHLRTVLVLDALEMAISQHRPRSVIYHSDQGSQGGFNRSSQHLCALPVAPGRGPRQVSAS